MKGNNCKRILISRTDRIGDVLLSTPLIKAVRQNFPKSYIAMLIRPYARDIVLGNPYLNEVISYDKYGQQRNILKTIAFAWRLRRKRFDLALILHPTNRAHLIAFLAGIKTRVGFDRNLRFLLTDKIKHRKQEGEKHEAAYTLDFIRWLEINAQGYDLFMPIRKDSELYIDQLLTSSGVDRSDKVIAFNPGASCPSKMWPVERFAQVAETLADELKAKIVVVSGPDNIEIGKRLAKLIRSDFIIDVSGRTSVSQLGSLLKRCCLFISNDSGPVHIAAALGVPVVAIFGRKQSGLSPRRWGPIGEHNAVLHQDVGCGVCLAHNCQKGFACLDAISVQEVLSAARKLINSLKR